MLKMSLRSVKYDFLKTFFCNTCSWEVLWKSNYGKKETVPFL